MGRGIHRVIDAVVDFEVNFGKNSTMLNTLPESLERLSLAATARGHTRTQWAERAGLRKETLSRLFRRSDCDFGTLVRLADAAGLRVDFVAEPDREMPATWDRDAEAALVQLCASGSFDLRRWMKAGPRYFMAGLATLCANAYEGRREEYLALAQALCPAMREPAEFSRWLALSPAKPSRFLPLMRARQKALA